MDTMTPSEEISEGQAAKVEELLAAALRKSGLKKEAVQTVLKSQGAQMVSELVAVVRKFVEAVSNLIVRKVSVNRGRTQQEAIEATGRAQYTDRKVVDAMPKGEGDEAEVVFFKPDLSQRNGFISDYDLDKEYELRGLKPADPISVAAVNEADPAFADEKPHGTHWKDAEGKWCFAAFSRWGDDGREVGVHRGGNGWDGYWWFAGVRK